MANTIEKLAKRASNNRGKRSSARVKLNATLSITQDHHKSLLNALMHMMMPHISIRNEQVGRFDGIVREYAAYLEHSEELEKDIARLHDTGKSTAIPNQKYGITKGIVQDTMTHVMNILFPARQMYGATELDPDKQNIAAAFTEVLNRHAQYFGHYTEYTRFVTNALVLNLGIVELDWGVKVGWLGDRLNNFGQQGNMDVIMEGNRITALDPYNTILDYSASIKDAASSYQFYAKVEGVSNFSVRQMATRGQLYGTPDQMKRLRDVTYQGGQVVLMDDNQPFYDAYRGNFGGGFSAALGGGLMRYRPSIRKLVETGGKGEGGCFDVNEYLNAGEAGSGSSITKRIKPNEVITVTAKLVPKDYGLSSSDELQIWRFRIVNGTWVGYAEQVAAEHGLLPIGITQPEEFNLDHEDKGLAEELIPFQNLISNIHNLYLRGMRSNVNNGLIFYDQQAIQLSQIQDPSAGMIGVNRTPDAVGQRQRISDMIYQVSQRPEINTSMNDINQVMGLMQSVQPTEQLKALTDLNRATDHQSRSVSNAGSRRMFSLARIISEQGLSPLNYMMTKNVIALQQSVTVLDAEGSGVIEVEASTFREHNLEVAISDGLRGIDTVAIASRVSQVLQYTLQSRTVNSEISPIKLLEYLMRMEGANFNIAQFRHKQPWDALQPEQKQIAFQLLQQAAQQQEEDASE